MRWLITGGCGFIGTNLIRRLAADGDHFIRVIDNLSVGTREDLSRVAEYTEYDPKKDLSWKGSGCDLIVGNILDAELAKSVARDADVIVHLAANTGVAPSVENPRADCETNVIGTLNYLEAARINNVKRFVFASSGASVGEIDPPIHEEMAPHPVSPYGASKLAGEGYCSAYYRTFKVDTVALRFGNVYGPGSTHKGSVVAKFIKRALAGQPLEIYGDGTQTRDFIYIDDLIKAVTLAATVSGIGGETFQIATSSETTVGKMTEQLKQLLETRGIENIYVFNGETRAGDVKRNYSDTTKAWTRLGWEPETGLESGLAQTIGYFLDS